MTTAQIEAGTLTANFADRVVSGLLLPYGEVGNTNLGRFTVPPGVITIPVDVTVLAANTDHARESPVARFLTAVETPAGIVSSFQVSRNPDGDALLAELADTENPNARRRLSVEIAGVVLRDGIATAGRVFGAAFVKRGAFPSATVLAADTPDPADASAPVPADAPAPLTPDDDGVLTVESTAQPATVLVVTGETRATFRPEVETNPEGEPAVVTATAPNTLTATTAATTTTTPSSRTRSVFELLHAIRQGHTGDTVLAELRDQVGDQSLFAALNDVKYDGTNGLAPAMTQSQFIGELWAGREYRQLVAPLFSHGDLTSLTVTGWSWGTKPAGADWSGNKTAVPSNAPSVSPETFTASRFAGAHDHAREYVDFNTPGYFESYYKAMTESYLEWVDGKVAAAVTDAATAVVADNPSGLAIGAGLSALIDGATEVITANALPTFALVAPALWKSILKTPSDSTLAYLTAALGLDDGSLSGFTIRPYAGLDAGSVLVGASNAATVLELPGEAPIRVDALDMVKGGVDTGVFGYSATVIHKADALVKVTPYTAGP